MVIQTLSYELINEIKSKHPNLKILNLANNAIKSIANLELLPNLRNLNFSNNKLESMQGLNVLRNLENLNVAGNLISN